MTRRVLMIAPLIAALASAGCSDSTGPTSVLSETELQIAVFNIFELAFVRPVSVVPGVTDDTGTEEGPALAPVRYDSEVIETFPCEFGGDVLTLTRSTGFVNDETPDAGIDFLVELAHQNCVAGLGSDRVTFNANPGLEANYRFDRQSNGFLEVRGGILGFVDIVTDSANLRCRANIVLNATIVDEVVQYSFAGSLCERGVQGTVS